MNVAFRAILGASSAGGGGGGGDPVEYVDSENSNRTGSETSTTFDVPATAEPGDVLVVAMAIGYGAGEGVGDYDGFTELHVGQHPNFDRETYVAYIVLPDPVPATYTWTHRSANMAVIASAFRNADPTTPIADDGWAQAETTPELTAVEGAAGFGVWRATSTQAECDPLMTTLLEDYGGGSNIEIGAGYETGLTAGAYQRTGALYQDDGSASLVVIQPAIANPGGGGGGGYRYYRLNISDNNSDSNYTATREFQLYSTVGGANIASGGTITITDDYGGSYSGANMIDDDFNTFGLSQNSNVFPVTWEIDLGSAAEVAEYGIASPGGASYNRGPRDFTFEGSNDGTAWTVLDTQTGITWSSTYQTVCRKFTLP